MSYGVAKLKSPTGPGEYQGIRILPFNAKISRNSVSQSSWATAIGGGESSTFRVTRVTDGRQFMIMSSRDSARGTFHPVILEDVQLKSGDPIAIEQIEGPDLTDVIINLYFTKY